MCGPYEVTLLNLTLVTFEWCKGRNTENGENKLIWPKRVCNNFQRWSTRGNDEEGKLFHNFKQCKMISYNFSKRQLSQRPLLVQ